MRIHADNGIFRTRALCLLAIARVAVGTSVSLSSIESTCPARRINYITQTLAQQCLTSSWASKAVAQTSTDITTSKNDASTGVLSVEISPTSFIEPSVTATNHAESSKAESNAPSSISREGAAQTDTSSDRAESVEPTGESSQENDLDSPLDNSKFLSFEEWKHQNLAKVGQSAEALGKRQENDGSEHRRRPASINNALETFGEDSEIDIDFSGFVNAGGMNEALPIQSSLPVRSGKTETPKENAEDLSNTHKRNKDAGKTCKERSNYASFDCAATVLKTNPECKSATSVLVESKDSYMLNVCSANNKFFIVELCDDILVDTIVFANFEYFSSMFRTFRISVSDRYPVKMDRWKDLGTFEARNSRAIQAFLIENPLIWARYLRIEFLTHFGAEYYCPVSLLRVHGTTMMEEFNHEVKGLRPEDEADDEAEDIKNGADVQPPDAAHTEELRSVAEAIESPPTLILSVASTDVAPTLMPSRETQTNGGFSSLSTKGSTPYRASIVKGLEDVLFCRNDHGGKCSYVHYPTESESTSSKLLAVPAESENPILVEETMTAQFEDSVASEQAHESSGKSSAVSHDMPIIPSDPSHHSRNQNGTGTSHNATDPMMRNRTSNSADANSTPAVISSVVSSARDVASSSSTTSIAQPSGTDSSSIAKNSIQGSSSPAGVSSSSSQSSSAASAPPASVKTPSSSTQPPAANPSTQESFFKSVHKRLQQLEANSTLSLQYIEEQSRILRDAFSSVEKRQLSKTSTFLETLNTTVLTELREFRTQYDQIWQSTVLELSSQREQSAQQVSILSARMTFLADEIVFQKRVAIVQFMLILLCLGLIVFSRTGRPSTYLELPPLVHNAIKRSSANLARYTHFETPPASPSSSRPPSEGLSSKYGLFHSKSHRRTPSDESDANGGIQSPLIAYSPPSPVSQISRDDREASPSGPSADELENLSFN